MKRSKASPCKEKKKSFFGKRRQLIIFRGQYKILKFLRYGHLSAWLPVKIVMVPIECFF